LAMDGVEAVYRLAWCLVTKNRENHSINFYWRFL
jgi:hypothetical protein